MYNIYLLENFNNYYNRRIIRYDTLIQYLNHQTINEHSYAHFQANFIPNDGKTTEHVVNSQQLDITWNPDYVLIVDSINEIYQRWFVIDSVRTTMGQYRLSLKRDSISDFYNETINAPCFVEKATLSDNNPLIYNSENFSVNQIKQSETFLKDKTNTPWIVGYLSNGNLDLSTLDGGTPIESNGLTVAYEFNIPAKTSNVPDYTTDDFYSLVGIPKESINIDGNEPIIGAIPKNALDLIPNTEKYFQFNFEIDTLFNVASTAIVFDGNGNLSGALESRINYSSLVDINTPGVYLLDHGKENWEIKKENLPKVADAMPTKASHLTSLINAFSYQWAGLENVNDKTSSQISAFAGKTVYESSSGILYNIKSVEVKKELFYGEVSNATAKATLEQLFLDSDLTQYLTNPSKHGPGEDCFYIGTMIPSYVLIVETQNIGNIKYRLPKNIRTLDDNPYRMFCMPLYSTRYTFTSSSSGSDFNWMSKEICFEVAMDISKKFSGAGWLSDLQILPYCPAQNWISKFDGKDTINLASNSNLKMYSDFTYIYLPKGESYTDQAFILFPNKSSTSFTIDCSIPVIDKKIENQCNFQRLCSPNYASAFEFNAVKNNGVDYFTVNMTCRPWNPFIQVYPNFKELYGKDFNDNRGLILGGDFSLPQVNDAWNTYELNNKTYQASFDRTIQNMEVMHKMDMIGNVTGAVAGVGAAALQGGMTAGPAGAVAGAVGGLVGGAADIAMAQYRFNETRDLAKDQFGFTLENIRALPNTISKTSALTANHKLYPFIEFYSCTSVEKEAFKNKIKWNGMTVGVISDVGISAYLLPEESFIKAQLINIEIPEDAHVAQDISRELFQGVRIK